MIGILEDTMDEGQNGWVSLSEAAEIVGIPMTTIRDWSRFGMIDMQERATGRVVNVQQVRDKAMGPAASKPPSDLQDRVADEDPERSAGRLSREKELARTLQGLQQLARERCPATM
ncbi:MAG: hypothetical protein ABI869_05060 [Actinomycetota bacterium]